MESSSTYRYASTVIPKDATSPFGEHTQASDAAAVADRATVAAQSAKQRAAASEAEVQALRWELEALRRASGQAPASPPLMTVGCRECMAKASGASRSCPVHGPSYPGPTYSSQKCLGCCNRPDMLACESEMNTKKSTNFEVFGKMRGGSSVEETDNTQQPQRMVKEEKDIQPPLAPSVLLHPPSPPEEGSRPMNSRGSDSFSKSLPRVDERRASLRLQDNDEKDPLKGEGADGPKTPLFGDVSAMKEKVRQTLLKPKYDVSDFYKAHGLFRKIATSGIFDKLTLLVIAFNALWIGIDSDYNHAEVLLKARPLFQLAEHSFCLYFGFEWYVRFMSFERKADGLRDGWFVFDSSLVCMMVLETWIFTLLMAAAGTSGSSSLGDASILRMARLARLSRMARMARLLRAMPELMILIKGIFAGTRSVFFTLCLLTLVIYVFAIGFSQTMKETGVGKRYFATVPNAMYTLMLFGTLMDNIGILASALGRESMLGASVFIIFVLLAALPVMNMLIGVLCEVVSAVAATEKESLTVAFVTSKLQTVLDSLDEDGDGSISQAEFAQILQSFEATSALQEVGVDVIGLVDFADFIFQGEVDDSGNICEKELSFEEFMNVVLQFRGSNNATVKDIVDLRKFIMQSIARTNAQVAEVKQLVKTITAEPKKLKVPHRATILPERPLVRQGSESSRNEFRRSKSLHGEALDLTKPWSCSSPQQLIPSSSSKMKFGCENDAEDCDVNMYDVGSSTVLH